MVTSACQLCGSHKLIPIIDLGYHPLADTFLKPEKLNDEEVRYPLRVLLCQQCGYATLQYVVPKEKRYRETDYSYTASNSPVSVKHFSDMAAQIISTCGVSRGHLVADIGSNDGELLNAFRQQAGCTVLGIEPAENIAQLAEKRTIPTLHRFFDAAAADEMLNRYSRARVITATNVFNHITDLNNFMADLFTALDDDGYFVFESPYLLLMVQQVAFDTIYLEHISYFAIKPLVPFFKRHKFHIAHIEHNDYMGGSIRVYLTKGKENKKIVKQYISMEEQAGLSALSTYKNFMEKVLHLRLTLCSELYRVKNSGRKIIGIGAATKGNTLLNYCNIDNTLLEFITDSSPFKIGKYTPGSHIIIKGDEDITPDITHALILPWNIGDFLKEKLKHLNLQFIIPRIEK